MASVTSLGTGSGLDLEGMITKLMAVEQQPLTELQNKATSYQSRISSLGTLKNALATLQSAAAAMTTSSGQTAGNKFATYSISVADTTVASASASTGATAGSYSLSAIVLATAQQISKSGIVPPNTAGTLSIKVGTGTAVDVTIGAGSSLTNVVDAINGSNADITASIVNNGTTNYLFLTSKDTGAANTITITGSDNGGTGWANGAFDYSGTAANSWAATPGQDASVDINNITVKKSASNTLTTAISGVSLTLLKAGSTTLTVNKDSTTALTGALNAFIGTYNSATSAMASLGTYNATTKIAGPLLGDSALSSAQSQVRNLLFNTVAGGTSAYQRLSDIGVSVAKDGTMSLDSSKLNKAISADYAGVTSLVSKVGSAYNTSLDSITGTSGTLVSATNSSTRMIANITQRETALSARLTQIEASYRKQFTALDTLIAGLKTTSNYLTQELAAIASNNTSSSK